MQEKPLITFLMPCLNEEEALPFCVCAIRELAEKNHYRAEIVIVDNGSTDRSCEVIASLKEGIVPVRLITESVRGYGSAYRAGLRASHGTYICMADADATYDFEAFPQFISMLESGADFVIGDRFSDSTARCAMPWAHYYIGNPVLSVLVRLLFWTPVRDIHCGQRALRSAAVEKMALESLGMEFASEMVVRASECMLQVEQIPIRYKPRIGESKLNPIRDGRRHIRYALAAVFLKRKK